MVGVWYRRKLRGTREASNGGRVRVRIIHGLNISHKEHTYLLQKYTSHRNQALRACSQEGGWQELTIARPRPPHKGWHSTNTSCSNFVTQRFTIRACYGNHKLQRKYFSNTQLLNYHDSNITISISKNNYQVSNFSQYSMHLYESFY